MLDKVFRALISAHEVLLEQFALTSLGSVYMLEFGRGHL